MNRKKTKNTFVCVFVVVGTLLSAGSNAMGDFVFGTPENLGPAFNSNMQDFRSGVSPDALSLYFNRMQADGSGLGELWVAQRATKYDPWDDPVNLGAWESSSVVDVLTTLVEAMGGVVPGIGTADDLEMYFATDQFGGSGSRDLFVMKRESVDADWGAPINLGPTVNSSALDYHPFISPDGLTLYFPSMRGGGYGRSDLYMTTRATRSDPWTVPTNLGPNINSPSWDNNLTISPDGLMLLFNSGRPGGFGGSDIWVTRRASLSDPWGQAVNLGPTVNSPVEDNDPRFAFDGAMLYFSSDRPGGYGGLDLWQAPIIPIVDFNGDGQVDGKDLLVMIVEFGGTDALCDIGPTPWGDGVVDFEDLKVLAEYIGEEVTDPTLTAYWPLDETEGMTAYDMAGENDATVVGGAIWQPDGGMVGGALQFDGVSSFAVAGAVPSLRDGPFSILAWVKSGAADEVVLSSGITDWLYTNPADGSLMTALSSAVGNGVPLFCDVVITDGQWHRIGLVWDGSSRILYVDGQEAARDEQAELAISDNGLMIGTSATPGRFFSGQIDDIRIYKRAVKP